MRNSTFLISPNRWIEPFGRNIIESMIHGALVLDETEKKVIYRDTLQLENLDLNELEASIESLSLLLCEYSDEIIAFSK